MAEAFNCNVNWNDNTFVVTITSNPIDYSKVEQNTSTEPPTTTVPDSFYASTTARYYPGTDAPDYTYVTGIEQKTSPFYGKDGMPTYIYRNTQYGEYSEVIDYISYLGYNGWSLYNSKRDSTSMSWYYVKGDRMIGVHFTAEYDEIWISPIGY